MGCPGTSPVEDADLTEVVGARSRVNGIAGEDGGFIAVWLVCHDEADVEDFVWVVDTNPHAIFVSGDVEDYPTILKDAGSAELGFHVVRLRPVGLQGIPVPGKWTQGNMILDALGLRDNERGAGDQ